MKNLNTKKFSLRNPLVGVAFGLGLLLFAIASQAGGGSQGDSESSPEMQQSEELNQPTLNDPEIPDPIAATTSGETAGDSAGETGKNQFRLTSFSPNSATWLWHGGGLLLSLPFLLWVFSRPRRVNNINLPGFEIITHSEKRSYIPLEEKFQQMDFLAGVQTLGSLRLSANLNKVNLSFRRNGYLLEDKNFRNALLVNRRRVRRTLLKDGDVLDLGDLTLLYRDNRIPQIIRNASITPREGKVQVKFSRIRGPVRKGTPMLIPEQQPNRIFYITKNMIYLGRSESNDLIVKSKDIKFRHAKIERLGTRYKLIDLANSGNTFVNNRRVEHRILKDGDEIAFDVHRFKYKLTSSLVKEPSYGNRGFREGAGDENDGMAPGGERETLEDDKD